MATRDLFDDFAKLRSDYNRSSPYVQQPSRKAGVDPTDGIHMQDLEASRLYEEEKPEWTSIVDFVRNEFEQLQLDVNALSKVRDNQLKPKGFDPDENEAKELESQAQDLNDAISSHFTHCHKWIDMIARQGAGDPQDQKVRKNVQIALATKLQKLSTEYRRNQKSFMKRYADQKQKSGDNDLLGDQLAQMSRSWDDDDEEQACFTQAQMQDIDHMAEMVDERDKEIQGIARQITQLNEIFKELSSLVIDSGTILDRIDYNMEVVTVNFEEAHKHLEAASKYSGKGLTAWCIIILLLACIIMAIVVGVKQGKKDDDNNNNNRRLLALPVDLPSTLTFALNL